MFSSKVLRLFVVLFMGTAVFFTGCEKKDQPANNDTTNTTTVDTVKTPPAPVTPTLTGNWTGKFRDKKMVLKVASQTGSDFEGETTVSWAKPLVSKVKGSVDPATKALKFEDVERGPDAGLYEGTLSEDGKTFTGKFSLNSAPNKTFDVTLKMD